MEARTLGGGSDLVAVWEVMMCHDGVILLWCHPVLVARCQHFTVSWCRGVTASQTVTVTVSFYPQVHLADGIHVIEFEHGTTSGSRVLRVDRQVGGG